jgi:hypothetical protein
MRLRTLSLVLVIPCLAAAARVADAGRHASRPGGHPHFDDRGTLTWYTTFAEAAAAARAEGRVILVDYGRLRCKLCKVFCQETLPHCDVRERVAKIAVGLAADCDDPEAFVDQTVRRGLPTGRILPLVGFIHPDGRWISGFSGPRSTAEFLGDIALAERALTETRAKVAAARPAPAPTPKPATTAVAVAAPAAPPATPPAVVRPCADASSNTVQARATEAARRGAWGDVMRYCRGARGGQPCPVLAALEAQAREWAQQRLTDTVTAIEGRRFDEATTAVGAVREAMAGEPEATDASRGLVAIRFAQRLGELDAHDEDRLTMRRSAIHELRGTRWEPLFA